MDVETARPYIEAALEYAGGTHTFADIERGLAADEFQLWCGPHSAIITEIHEYPQKRAINFFLAGGKADEMEKMEPLILEWARSKGCTLATFTGRRGWERISFIRNGWDSSLVVFEKSLDGEEGR